MESGIAKGADRRVDRRRTRAGNSRRGDRPSESGLQRPMLDSRDDEGVQRERGQGRDAKAYADEALDSGVVVGRERDPWVEAGSSAGGDEIDPAALAAGDPGLVL